MCVFLGTIIVVNGVHTRNHSYQDPTYVYVHTSTPDSLRIAHFILLMSILKVVAHFLKDLFDPPEVFYFHFCATMNVERVVGGPDTVLST